MTDYRLDANMVAYYMFETVPGLNQSGTGDNHVDDAGNLPDEDAVNFKEGSQSADFVIANADYMRCNNGNLTADFPGVAASDSFTIICWLRLHAHVANQVISAKYSNTFRFLVTVTPNLFGTVYYSDGGGGNVTVTGSTAITHAGEWHHVGLVLNGAIDKLYLYLDGAIDNGAGADFAHTLKTGTNNFMIGAYDGPSAHLGGNLDEFAVFDRALSTAEIQDIMNNGLAGSSTLLVIADGSHAHTADEISNTQHNILSIADGTHAHTSDGISLTQHNVLSVADGAHAHTADGIYLTQHSILAIQAASHVHTADNISLTAYVPTFQLVIQDGSHAHSADSLSLTQHNVLSVADASHAHTADEISLTQHNVLSVADGSHVHIAENIDLTFHMPGRVVVTDSTLWMVTILDIGLGMVVMADARTTEEVLIGDSDNG